MSVIKLGRHPDLPGAWKPAAMPRSLGECVDLLVKVYKQRKKKEAEAEQIGKQEAALKEHMLQVFDKESLRQAKTKKGSVTLAEKDVPRVKDKEAFGKWVAKHGAWDLLYGKAVEEGCKARWDDGVDIDGVEKYHDVKIKLNEVK